MCAVGVRGALLVTAESQAACFMQLMQQTLRGQCLPTESAVSVASPTQR